MLPTPIFLDFPGGSDGKESACTAEAWVRSLGWEDPLEEGMATHSSILAWRIPMDRRAWQATVHGVAQNQTRLKRLSSSSSSSNAGDPSLIPGLGRSAGEGIGYPLQYS